MEYNGNTSFRETVEYITGNTVNFMVENYRKARMREENYKLFVKAYNRYFVQKKDYYHVFTNMVIKRLKYPPYMRIYKTEWMPALYESGGLQPTFENAILDMKENIESISEMKFVDNKSYDVLNTLMVFRLTGRKDVLFNNMSCHDQTYFDKEITPFFSSGWSRIFVDCGAYIGDTIESLLEKGVEYDRLYAFEANLSNYHRMISRMGNSPRILFINKAVGETQGYIRISDNDLSSHISAKDGNKVQLVDLDNEIPEKVTYIKMDIEGAELDAIKGAKQHIRNDKPIMAISVYHKLEDFHKLYDEIKNLVPEYRFAMRHYEKIPTDFVLYAFI